MGLSTLPGAKSFTVLGDFLVKDVARPDGRMSVNARKVCKCCINSSRSTSLLPPPLAVLTTAPAASSSSCRGRRRCRRRRRGDCCYIDMRCGGGRDAHGSGRSHCRRRGV